MMLRTVIKYPCTRTLLRETTTREVKGIRVIGLYAPHSSLKNKVLELELSWGETQKAERAVSSLKNLSAAAHFGIMTHIHTGSGQVLVVQKRRLQCCEAS